MKYERRSALIFTPKWHTYMYYVKSPASEFVFLVQTAVCGLYFLRGTSITRTYVGRTRDRNITQSLQKMGFDRINPQQAITAVIFQGYKYAPGMYVQGLRFASDRSPPARLAEGRTKHVKLRYMI